MKAFVKTLVLLIFVSESYAAHIGDMKISRIRHYNANYLHIWFTSSVSNLPSCANRANEMILKLGDDDAYANRRMAMALLAKSMNLSVNPNCFNECQHTWGGHQVMVCHEMSIQ